MSSREGQSQTQLLNELLAEHRISARRLARALAGTDEQKALERDRRNVTRWRGGEGISDGNASRLVAAFRGLGVILPHDYFMKPRGDPTWQEKMEERMQSMQWEIEELRRQLGG